MKYRLLIADSTAEVDVSTSDAKDNPLFNIGNKTYPVLYAALSESCYHLTVEGKTTKVFVARGNQGKFIFVKGCGYLVQDADERLLQKTRRSGMDETPGEVTPPMPAVVVRILIHEGDRVKRGQGLIVVTAMKMETTLVAPSDGRVKKINTSEGAKVVPGEILVEIEEEAKDHE